MVAFATCSLIFSMKVRHKNCSLLNFVSKHNSINSSSQSLSDLEAINRIICDSRWIPSIDSDTPVWEASPTKAYTTHSFYMAHEWHLTANYRHKMSRILPIPPSIFTFTWSLIWDGIPTLDKIITRFQNWSIGPVCMRCNPPKLETLSIS